MDPFWIGLISVLLVLFLLALGIPIALSLALSGFICIATIRGLDTALSIIAIIPYDTIAAWAYIIVPLFIFLGYLAFSAGVGQDAYSLVNKWLGHFPGGLAMATIGGAAAFAATSGSSFATVAAIGKLGIPEMRDRGYDMRLAAGAVASGGTLGVLIPPSGVLVIYGMLVEEPIGKLLVAGILPGIIAAIIYFSGIYFWARFGKLGGEGEPSSWKERLWSLKDGTRILILFLIVMGGIYTGIFTPTEAAAFGAATALVMLFIRPGNRLRAIAEGLREAARTSAMVFLIFLGAMIFSKGLTLARIPQTLSAFLVSLPVSPIWLLVLLLLPYLPLGMFLDPVSMMALTLPIVFPVVQSLGFSGIWFGILVTKMIEISFITPPVGLNVYILKGVFPEIELRTIFEGCIPFLAMDLLNLALFIVFPGIVLFLPGLMTG